MFFFKKRKNKIKKPLIDSELDIDAEFNGKNIKDSEEYRIIQQMQYVRTQCEQVADSSKYIAELKTEYQVVCNYISDLSIIDNQNETTRKALKKNAEEILKLISGREKLRNGASLLSPTRYGMFEQYKGEFPEALTNFINDEKYCQNVKHDMRILEAEKVSLKEDMKDLEARRINVRNISVISLLGIIAVFIIFIISGQLNNDNGMILFMVVLLLAAVFVLLICVLLKNTTYKFKLSEKKLARAVTLLNKTKIKYVNIVNSVDYLKAKYNVRNSLELSKEYEAYLTEKKRTEKYRSSTVELNDAIERLNSKLTKLNLYDVSIWEKQVEALCNDKVMKEVRRTLNNRRQKLREQMDYNMDRIEDAKNGILNFVKKHPELSSEVMGIVNSYDVDF